MKTEEEIKQQKPCCKVCGKSMKHYEFKGYYDNFYFWDFDCDCNNDISFQVDEVEKGAYA